MKHTKLIYVVIIIPGIIISTILVKYQNEIDGSTLLLGYFSGIYCTLGILFQVVTNKEDTK